jgi:hypothetical protein
MQLGVKRIRAQFTQSRWLSGRKANRKARKVHPSHRSSVIGHPSSDHQPSLQQAQ